VVVVGFPATPLTGARARFCISAAHTREELKRALDVIKEIGSMLLMRHFHGVKKYPVHEQEQRQKEITRVLSQTTKHSQCTKN